jgi:hypothetical protein
MAPAKKSQHEHSQRGSSLGATMQLRELQI